MDIEKTVTVAVQIAYTVDDPEYPYMDTFTFPADEPMSDEAVDAKIAADYAAWKAYVQTPTPERTKADVKADIARAVKDLAKVKARQAKLDKELAARPVRRGVVRDG
jgi:hypothetical protein